jgi:hypothetical protein
MTLKVTAKEILNRKAIKNYSRICGFGICGGKDGIGTGFFKFFGFFLSVSFLRFSLCSYID